MPDRSRPKIAGTIPVHRVPKGFIARETRHQEGRAGLWATASFFENSRTLRVTDPTEFELEELTKMQRAYTQLRENNGKGRVVL